VYISIIIYFSFLSFLPSFPIHLELGTMPPCIRSDPDPGTIGEDWKSGTPSPYLKVCASFPPFAAKRVMEIDAHVQTMSSCLGDGCEAGSIRLMACMNCWLFLCENGSIQTGDMHMGSAYAYVQTLIDDDDEHDKVRPSRVSLTARGPEVACFTALIGISRNIRET